MLENCTIYPLQELKKRVEFSFLIQTTPFEVAEKRAVLEVSLIFKTVRFREVVSLNVGFNWF